MNNEELNLGDIPGLGPVRRAALAEAGIHDLQGLLRLKVAELAAIRGVGLWQARKIAEFLRQRGLVLEVEVTGGEAAVVLVPPDSADDRAAMSEVVDTLKAQAAIEAHLEAEVAQLQQAVTASRDGESTDTLTDEETVLLESSTAAPEGYEQTVREALARAAQPETSATLLSNEAQNGGAPGAAAEPEPPAGGESSRDHVKNEIDEETQPEAAGTTAHDAPEPEAETEPEARDGWQDRIREQRQQLPEAALELMEAIRAAAVNKQLTRQITRLLITAGEFINDSRPLSPQRQKAASQALELAEQSLRRAIEKRSFSPGQQKDLAGRIRRRRKQLEQLLERE